MKQRILPVFIVAAMVIFCQPGFSQAQEKPTDAGGVSAQAPAVDSDIQWLWGEVSSVAAEKNEVVVKYLDYEADVEKDMTVAVTDKTTYENIKGLGELKSQDTVSIDYIVVDGKSVAKNISVEKPEVMPVADTTAAAPAGSPSAVPMAGESKNVTAAVDSTQAAPVETAAPAATVAPVVEPVAVPAPVEIPPAEPVSVDNSTK